MFDYKEGGWVSNLQHARIMEFIATNASYASIANVNIIRGRPNGSTRRVVYAKRITTRVAWISGREFMNAMANYIPIFNHAKI